MSTDTNATKTSTDSHDRRLIAGAREQVEQNIPTVPGENAETVVASPSPAGNEPRSTDAPVAIPGYQIKRKLSGGGQGVVYEALQLSTKRRVAVKVIRGGILAHPENKKRLDRGVRILGQLHHPNIVGIIDSGSIDGCQYYVMEYVAGVSLDDYMTQQRATSFVQDERASAARSTSRSRRSKAESRAERQSMHRLLTIFARICEGLDAAHVKGVIHRDIKPANILIDTRGEPHILDFDLAKILDGGFMPDETFSAMTVSGEFLGSLRWASPEQVERKPSGIDLRTDVYSLGVVLFEMLTGQFPYPVVGARREIEDNILHAAPVKPRSIRKAVDDDLETIVLKCLAKEPTRRYRSAGELATDVRSYLAGEAIAAKRDSSWYLLKKLAARHRGITTAFAASLVILLSSLTYVAYAWRHAAQANERMHFALGQAQSAKADAEDLAGRAGMAIGERQFLWFLAEWNAGAMHRARQAAEYFGPRSLDAPISPEAATAALLLGEIDENAFAKVMPPNAELLKRFALAEVYRRDGRHDDAAEQLEQCRVLNGPAWLKREAAERLASLRAAPSPTTTRGDR